MIGQNISHYKIIEKLGGGGMGVVYKAEDTKLKRIVALKFLPPDLTRDEVATERLVHEAQAASALQHNNICTVHDIDESDDGRRFIVMDCYEGETLKQRLQRGALPIGEALSIAHQIAQGLAKAHERGILHRDIKPANIFITTEATVKIVDFGLAKLQGRTQLTRTGSTIGTVAYMSPEQAQGSNVDQRSDIWSLGVVLYEMLTGRLPFAAEHEQAVLYLIMNQDPEQISKLRPEIPLVLEEIVKKAMEKKQEKRYQHAEELLANVQNFQRTLAPEAQMARPKHRLVIAALATFIVAIIASGGWFWWRQSRVNWARTVAIPEAKRTFGLYNLRGNAAFRLLREAEAYIPEDPILKELLSTYGEHVTVQTKPPGVQVSVRDFFDKPDDWDVLGRSPIRDVLLPAGIVVFKLSHEGYQTKEVVGGSFSDLEFSLDSSATAPEGMVHVPGGPYNLLGQPPVQLKDYWLDKYEVTNKQFKEFVDRGGYEKREYWREPFIKDGAEVSWEEAMKLFRDRTGRPGPAIWSLGTYPEGQEDFPVGGISWYETAAYCASVSKQLPTIYHWYNAAAFDVTNDFASYSNFDTTGAAKVGHRLRLNRFGSYDMAGNVKEWVWNEADASRRYILGGGWNEPSYMYNVADAQRPIDRQPTFGFRCVKLGEPLLASLTSRVERPERDFSRETPVSDKVYAVYEGLYHYDRSPLDARTDSTDDTPLAYKIEFVNFAAAYGKERIPALLFLPKGFSPPYQTVVWFPGGGPFYEHRPMSVGGGWGYQYTFLFLVRSGRAVLYPMYKGTFTRDVVENMFSMPNAWRNVVIADGKDLGRAVDYLETRADIDSKKLAYYALSVGAGLGPIMTAIEKRFKASVLYAGGLPSPHRPPESEAINFAPRVHVPTLLINGKHDFAFPLETSQKPLFHLLGTKDKRHRVFESGHVPTEQDEVMKEILDWLDKYLGRVNKR